MNAIKFDRASRDAYSAASHKESAGYIELAQARLREVHASYPTPAYPPPIFRKDFIEEIAGDAVSLINVLMRIPEVLFDGDYEAWALALGFPRQTAKQLSGYCSKRSLEVATAFARPDVLLTETGRKFLEFNISPYIGGPGTYGRLASFYRDSPFLHVLDGFDTSHTDGKVNQAWCDTVRQIARSHGDVELPTFYLAVAEPDSELQTDWVRHDFSDLVRQMGYKAVVGSMRGLAVKRHGVFSASGQAVQVVFTCMTYPEMVADGVPATLIDSLVKADEDGIADLICAPINTLFESKVNLALLHDARFLSRITPVEQATVRALVPFTCRLDKESIRLGLSAKDQFVLKPASDHSGNGVLIGPRLTTTQWHDALYEALASTGEYILQYCVSDVLRYADDDNNFANICLGPIVTGGQCHGSLVRVQPFDGKVNVMNSLFGSKLAIALAMN